MKTLRVAIGLMILVIAAGNCYAGDEAERAAAVKGAKITPIDAVVKAAKEVEGGKVWELEVEVGEGVPNYEIRIAYFGEKHTIDIACATGEIIKKSNRGDPRLGLIKWSKVKTPIEKAMATALEKAPGQIIEVDLSNGAFQPRFEVIVFKDGVVTEVHVDAETGGVMKVEID